MNEIKIEIGKDYFCKSLRLVVSVVEWTGSRYMVRRSDNNELVLVFENDLKNYE